MALSNTALTVIALFAFVVALLALYLAMRIAARDSGPGSVKAASPDKRAEAQVEAHGKAIQRLEGAVRKLAHGERQLGQLAKDAIRHVGVVRFDAFEDMGGRLSFSAALLDAHGDGVVITSINGRQDTRCYAKRVQSGTSIHNLSDEERQAIREALESSRQIVEAS
jgi:uncharacterized protein YlxW (UPF0749 family)